MSTTRHLTTTTSRHRRAIAAAVIGTVLVALYAGWAAVHILALNPLAAAPSRTLTQIHQDLAGVGESLGTPFVLAVLAVGVVLAGAVLAFTAVRREMTTRAVTAIYLILLSFGSVAYTVASFGAGMALADTYGVAGGNHAAGAGLLYTVSGLAAVVAVALAVTTIWSTQRQLPVTA